MNLSFATVVVAGVLISVAPPAESKVTLLTGDCAGGTLDGDYPVTFVYQDARTGRILRSVDALATVKNGKYLAKMPSKGLGDGLYAVSAQGGGHELIATTYVLLQSTTPGTQQVGHVNISGVLLAGKIGVGTSNPFGRVGVITSDNVGVHSQASGIGVFGKSNNVSGTSYGGYFYSMGSSGTGVYGEAYPSSGTTYGVYGKTNSATGYGGYFVGRGYFSGRVGIGTSNPLAALDVFGTARLGGFSMPTGATSGFVLTSDALGNASWQAPKGGGLYYPGDGITIGENNVISIAPLGVATNMLADLAVTDAKISNMAWSKITGVPAGQVDVSGTYPSLSVIGLQGRSVSSAAPTSGQVLAWNGSAWAPSAGLQLPFAGSTNSAGPAFDVTNTGGTAIKASSSGVCLDGTGEVYLRNDSAGAALLFAANDGPNPNGSGTGATIRMEAKSGTGLLVQLTGGNGSGTAVMGQSSSTWANSYGVFAVGNLGATGNKTFVIDDPNDPENKYLVHYCHEGPEPRNDYYGSSTLDGRGTATVVLPSYYAKINRDPLVFLTAIGKPMPGVYVDHVTGTGFVIAGGTPGGRVNWMLSGVRNDRWNQQNPIEDERMKPEELRGTYLQPELYGQPAWKSEVAVKAGKAASKTGGP